VNAREESSLVSSVKQNVMKDEGKEEVSLCNEFKHGYIYGCRLTDSKSTLTAMSCTRESEFINLYTSPMISSTSISEL